MSRYESNRYPELAKILAIAKLTVRSAFRFRLVTVIVPLLGAILFSLP